MAVIDNVLKGIEVFVLYQLVNTTSYKLLKHVNCQSVNSRQEKASVDISHILPVRSNARQRNVSDQPQPTNQIYIMKKELLTSQNKTRAK